VERVVQSLWSEGDKPVALVSLEAATEGEGGSRCASTVAEEVDFVVTTL
jgi:hypothetical protein